MIAEFVPDGIALFPATERSTGEVGLGKCDTGNCNISEPEKISTLISPTTFDGKSGMTTRMFWMESGSSLISSSDGDDRTTHRTRLAITDTSPLRNLTLIESTLGPPLE
jgi:hypothetical protein